MEDQDANEATEKPHYAAILPRRIWNNMTPIKILILSRRFNRMMFRATLFPLGAYDA